MFYLQNESAGYCGNSPMWWAKGGNGYTPRLDQAQQFDGPAADAIIRGCQGSHRMVKWPVAEVEAATYRAVDIQVLRKEGTLTVCGFVSQDQREFDENGKSRR